MIYFHRLNFLRAPSVPGPRVITLPMPLSRRYCRLYIAKESDKILRYPKRSYHSRWRYITGLYHCWRSVAKLLFVKKNLLKWMLGGFLPWRSFTATALCCYLIVEIRVLKGIKYLFIEAWIKDEIWYISNLCVKPWTIR